jgi:hypothetical protein
MRTGRRSSRRRDLSPAGRLDRLSMANVERRPQSIHGRRALVDDQPALFRRVGLRRLAEKIPVGCGRSCSIDGTAASGVGYDLSQLGSDAGRKNTERYPLANAPTYSTDTPVVSSTVDALGRLNTSAGGLCRSSRRTRTGRRDERRTLGAGRDEPCLTTSN